MDYLENDKEIVTCFRDAIVGSTKMTTWYQYGFGKPQGPLKKEVNGLHVREVSDWFVRRLGLPLGEDELPEQYLTRSPEWEKEFDEKHPENDEKSVDFPETDLIIIMARRRNRLILNEEELRAHLEATFGIKTIFVRNEDHSFEEQVELMRRARVVLAMHGRTVILEMFPYAVPSENYTPYKTMAELPGMALVYRAWEDTTVNLGEIADLISDGLKESRKILREVRKRNWEQLPRGRGSQTRYIVGRLGTTVDENARR
ncbi:Protein O-linked-mannose beta-1,4-N-acetylglucosaminyltransferase 2 [Phlyctochytrium bullatum]|nr:Protein O-linked-mannose beta-1,4-N-acetylglucosaminyltransferase 2 [Phlyctochytrium bullatum]